MLTDAAEVCCVYTTAFKTKCEVRRNVCRAVKDIVCSPVGAAFEIVDLARTEFSAARLTLLIDQSNEFVHVSSPVAAHFSLETCFGNPVLGETLSKELSHSVSCSLVGIFHVHT
jgi:hypothetical protein